VRSAALALLVAANGASYALAEDSACQIRNAKADSAWASAVVRVDATVEDASAGRGDHCDEQRVDARVVGPIKGPLSAGDPLRFSLSQGACGDPHSVNDDFTSPGSNLILLLMRDVAGGIYQTRAEKPEAYARAQAACGKPLPSLDPAPDLGVPVLKSLNPR
jgi:hypothetical protein